MIKFLRNVFGVAELRGKVLFTIAMLALYRLGSYIPAPGIDQNAVNSIKQQAEQGGVLAFLQLFSGKALTQFAVFALGHHAVHHQLDHHADPHGGDPQARSSGRSRERSASARSRSGPAT